MSKLNAFCKIETKEGGGREREGDGAKLKRKIIGRQRSPWMRKSIFVKEEMFR